MMPTPVSPVPQRTSPIPYTNTSTNNNVHPLSSSSFIKNEEQEQEEKTLSSSININQLANPPLSPSHHPVGTNSTDNDSFHGSPSPSRSFYHQEEQQQQNNLLQSSVQNGSQQSKSPLPSPSSPSSSPPPSVQATAHYVKLLELENAQLSERSLQLERKVRTLARDAPMTTGK